MRQQHFNNQLVPTTPAGKAKATKQQQCMSMFPEEADVDKGVVLFELAPEVGAVGAIDLQTLIAENYGTEEEIPVSTLFDRVRISPGGVTVFQVPGDDPDKPEQVSEIIGVIIDHYRINAYWPGAFTGEGTPPQCYSHDAKTGVGDPGGPCDSCEYNDWGSGKEGRGRACKNMWRLYILQSNSVLPVILTLPPTSLKAFREFLKNVTFRRRMRLTEAIIRFGLKREKNDDGILYSKVTFTLVGQLTEEQAQAIKQYAKSIEPLMRRPPRTAAEITLDYAPGDAIDPAEFGDDNDSPDF